ncbi:sensor histidine kinase [Marinoscillum pacificum]|uniref:sensor histidine kinase n=1 Tax=Marinoscillum pacificum TaxID=392723 RepID=UPI002158544A|nr:HAMP domain-containing sensor histidine kinase [Marinoscillum pacificum]
MKEKLNDNELIQQLESRPGLLAKYLNGREQKLMDELMSVNKKLVVAEQIKTDFLSNIRNEIINPISALLELSQSLVDQSSERSSRIASLIYDETFQLNFQMTNILASAELEAGEVEMKVSRVNLKSLVNSVINSFKKLLKKKKMSIELIGLNESQVFVTDSEKLNLILSNLISNAIQFSFTGGKIEISCLVEEGTLHLSVCDFGIGISKADQEEVFSRFTQLDRGSVKAHPGHGLGLSLTKALLETLDGKLTLESESNKGSVFAIHVPELTESLDSSTFSSVGNEFLFDDNDGVF